MATPRPVVRAVVKSNRIRAINAAFPGAIQALLSRAAAENLQAAMIRVPVRTGTLKNSLQLFNETSGARLSAGVFTNVVYGPYVEFGTRYMAARPYLTADFERIQANLLRNLVALERALPG